MNQYGATAQKHWRRWLPKRYATISDPESFFTHLGEQISLRVEDLERALAGTPKTDETFMEKLGRLNMARQNAESAALQEMALLAPEPEADEDSPLDE